MGKLDFQEPVPADIEIAQSVTPVPISEIAKKLDISPDDFEPQGTTKAKASPCELRKAQWIHIDIPVCVMQ